MPALMVLYSTVDGLAWLAAKDVGLGTVRKNFEDWLGTFCENQLGDVTPADLYGARCAVPHSQTADSEITNSVKPGETARQVWYQLEDGSARIPLQLNTPRHPIVVYPRWLAHVIWEAAARFRHAIDTNLDFSARVQSRADKYFDAVVSR